MPETRGEMIRRVWVDSILSGIVYSAAGILVFGGILELEPGVAISASVGSGLAMAIICGLVIGENEVRVKT